MRKKISIGVFLLVVSVFLGIQHFSYRWAVQDSNQYVSVNVSNLWTVETGNWRHGYRYRLLVGELSKEQITVTDGAFMALFTRGRFSFYRMIDFSNLPLAHISVTWWEENLMNWAILYPDGFKGFNTMGLPAYYRLQSGTGYRDFLLYHTKEPDNFLYFQVREHHHREHGTVLIASSSDLELFSSAPLKRLLRLNVN